MQVLLPILLMQINCVSSFVFRFSPALLNATLLNNSLLGLNGQRAKPPPCVVDRWAAGGINVLEGVNVPSRSPSQGNLMNKDVNSS